MTSADPLGQVRRPINEARGLPNAAYVDDAWYAAEQQRIFAGGWVCAGVASEIPKPGDQRPVTVAGAPLVLVRAPGGEPAAFHNVCSHRGALLVSEPSRMPVIRCPYHSWAYGLDGRLLRTPDIGGPGVDHLDGFDPATCGLKPARLAQWADFLFVDLSGAAPPLEDRLAPLTERWQSYDLSLLRHAGTLEFIAAANWKLLVENAIEYYHLPWIHPDLTGYSPTDAHYHCDAGPAGIGTASRHYAAVAATGATLPEFPGLDDAQRRVAEYPVLFPNLFLGVHADHFFAMVLEPVSPVGSRERFHIYCIGDEALDEARAPAREAVFARWKQINDEDVAIAELLQRGRASPAFDGGRLTAVHDIATHRFMTWVADAMHDAATG